MRKYRLGEELQEPVLPGKDSRQTWKQLLVENAVCYFIKNHQMDEMIGNGESMRRQSVMPHRGFDFESEELCMEMKVFMPESDTEYGCIGQRLQQSIKQIIGYADGLSGSIMRSKRIILFVAVREGIAKEIKSLIGREIGINMALKKAVGMGMELWVAEMELKPEDGIDLLSYENITN